MYTCNALYSTLSVMKIGLVQLRSPPLKYKIKKLVASNYEIQRLKLLSK